MVKDWRRWMRGSIVRGLELWAKREVMLLSWHLCRPVRVKSGSSPCAVAAGEDARVPENVHKDTSNRAPTLRMHGVVTNKGHFDGAFGALAGTHLYFPCSSPAQKGLCQNILKQASSYNIRVYLIMGSCFVVA